MSLVIKEDVEILSKVLKVSLTASASPATGADAVVELTELQSELQSEAGAETSAEAVAARWADMSSRRSLFDRALVGRLSVAQVPVVDYLIAAFARCVDLKARKGSSASAELVEVFDYVAELAVSYAAIALQTPSMFPQPPEAEADGVLRLLGPLRADTLPAYFLARLVGKLAEEESLAEVFNPIFAKLREDALAANILTDFAGPYRALFTLVREKQLGALLSTDEAFVPLICRNGALLQAGARLGPWFGVSCFPAEHALAQQCFPDVSNPVSLEQSMSGLRNGLGLVQRALLSIAKELLKNNDAKEPLFKFIASACTLNATRSQQWFPHAEGQRLLHAIAPEQVRR